MADGRYFPPQFAGGDFVAKRLIFRYDFDYRLLDIFLLSCCSKLNIFCIFSFPFILPQRGQ